MLRSRASRRFCASERGAVRRGGSLLIAGFDVPRIEVLAEYASRKPGRASMATLDAKSPRVILQTPGLPVCRAATWKSGISPRSWAISAEMGYATSWVIGVQ